MTTIIATDAIATPTPTHLMGTVPESAEAPERLRKVFDRTRQRKTSPASPAATSMPVAGHITQKSTSFLVKPALMIP